MNELERYIRISELYHTDPSDRYGDKSMMNVRSSFKCYLLSVGLSKICHFSKMGHFAAVKSRYWVNNNKFSHYRFISFSLLLQKFKLKFLRNKWRPTLVIPFEANWAWWKSQKFTTLNRYSDYLWKYETVYFLYRQTSLWHELADIQYVQPAESSHYQIKLLLDRLMPIAVILCSFYKKNWKWMVCENP